jgi:hypothetical protein
LIAICCSLLKRPADFDPFLALCRGFVTAALTCRKSD